MSKKKKTTTEPWKKAQPYLLGAADNTKNTVANNAGNLQDISNDLAEQYQGLSDKVSGGNPLVAQGQGFISDTLDGDYLDGNPHTEQLLENTRNDITGNINSAFSRSSQANGSRHSQILARELAKAQNEIQFGQYNRERGNQMGALGMVPGITQADYQGYSLLPGFAGAAAEVPYAGVNTETRNQAGLFSPYSKTTQTQGFGSTLLNAAVAGASTASDFGWSPFKKGG